MDHPVIGIHQPECFPWLGFIAKALDSDVFILLDDVQFEKNYFQNRNRLPGANGPYWLTVPTRNTGRSSQTLGEIVIANSVNPRWRDKQLASWTQSYASAAYLGEQLPFLKQLYARPWDRLLDFNLEVIRHLFAAFGVGARVALSSNIKCTGKSSEKLLNLCQATGAKTYLSGISGRDYLDESIFTAAGIRIAYQDFRHPIYKQRSQPFEPCLTAFDLLFNEGTERARSILRDPSFPRLDKAFT
ncbi:MAG: WbqC family protein [Elusimicrobiota bacterium]